MPKRIASCRLASGRIFNRYATVINVSDGVLQKILFQDKILKTSTSAGLFLYKKLYVASYVTSFITAHDFEQLRFIKKVGIGEIKALE